METPKTKVFLSSGSRIQPSSRKRGSGQNPGSLNGLDVLVKSLQEKSDSVTKEFKELEDRFKVLNNDMRAESRRLNNLVFGIAVVMFVAFTTILFDYIIDDGSKHRELLSSMSDLSKDFYTKDEVREILDENATELDEFKECIRLSGLSQCLK